MWVCGFPRPQKSRQITTRRRKSQREVNLLPIDFLNLQYWLWRLFKIQCPSRNFERFFSSLFSSWFFWIFWLQNFLFTYATGWPKQLSYDWKVFFGLLSKLEQLTWNNRSWTEAYWPQGPPASKQFVEKFLKFKNLALSHVWKSEILLP